MTRRAVWAFLCSFIFLAACGSRASPSEKLSKTQLFSGPISRESVNSLINDWPSGARRLVITSQGGDINAGIALGRFLIARQVEVMVRDYCLSACAHFVFAPASRKLVEKHALVGFHGTATARELLLANSGRPELAKKYALLAEQEQRFYDDVGISRSLLIRPLRKVLPICYFSKESGWALIATRVNFFIPSRKSLIAQNVRNIAGYWPQSQDDIAGIANRIPQTVNATLRFEGLGEIGQDVEPRGVSVCPSTFIRAHGL